MPRIFDNIDLQLLPALKEILQLANRADFMFTLTREEIMKISQIVISSNQNQNTGDRLSDGERGGKLNLKSWQ